MKLIDRVVVEINDADVEDCTNEYVASVLRSIADEIENCKKGGHYSPDEGCEVLWEHEAPCYGGFKIVSDKSLISQYYYHSEPKTEKYVIIAHNYDRENSDAYPVGGLYATEEEAKQYLRDHIEEIKNDHWTADRVDGEDHYSEEFTCTGWEAMDADDGASLEINIHCLTE